MKKTIYNSKKYAIIFGLLLVLSTLIVFSAMASESLSNSDYSKLVSPDNSRIVILDKGGGLVADYKLDFNTNFCNKNCYFEITTNITDISLIYDKILFTNKEGKNQDISYKFYVVNLTGKTELNKEKTKTPGLIKGRVEATKLSNQSIEWIISAFGFNFTEWSWWNSWQDYNDDFEDNNLNNILWSNFSYGYSNFNYIAEHHSQVDIFSRGDDLGGGSVYEGKGGIQTMQDFNDGKNYTINFSIKSIMGTNGNPSNTFGIMIANTTLTDYGHGTGFPAKGKILLGRNLNIDTETAYSISIFADTRNATLYQGATQINSTILGATQLWYVSFVNQGLDAPTINNNLTIYNFTTKSTFINNVLLLSPTNNTLIQADFSYMSAFLSSNLTSNNVSNATLMVWNVSGYLVNTNFSSFTGLNTDEIVNLTATSLAYTTYFWNYKMVDTGNNIYIASSNKSIIFNDTIFPFIEINKPDLTESSLDLIINISASDKGGLSYCNFTIRTSTGADAGINDVEIPNCLNTTSSVSGYGNYIIFIQVNDTNHNINFTNRSFSVTAIIPPGTSSPGGGGSIVNKLLASITSPACDKYDAPFDTAWTNFKNEMSFDNFKKAWYSFWDVSICKDTASFIPLYEEIPT